MTGVGLLTLLTLTAGAGFALALSGWAQPAPPLDRLVEHQQRSSGWPDHRDGDPDHEHDDADLSHRYGV